MSTIAQRQRMQQMSRLPEVHAGQQRKIVGRLQAAGSDRESRLRWLASGVNRGSAAICSRQRLLERFLLLEKLIEQRQIVSAAIVERSACSFSRL